MPDVIDVRLVGLPTQVYVDSQQHTDELLREFALIAISQADERVSVPARLLALVDRLRTQYAAMSDPVRRTIMDAWEAGDATVDVVYHLPRGVVDAAGQLDERLDEADEFCRSGDLLTLATPPDIAAFRRWFLDEFRRQADGHPPTPWSVYVGT